MTKPVRCNDKYNELGFRLCIKCSNYWALSEFTRSKDCLDGLHPYCKLCKQYQKYKLTLDQVMELHTKQDNKCALCLRSGIKLYIDHDHQCCPGLSSCGKCIRGLLCHFCNLTLSRFDKDPTFMGRVERYLR